jgi:hypothetical protein
MSLCRRKALQLSGLGIVTLGGCTFGFGGTSDEVDVSAAAVTFFLLTNGGVIAAADVTGGALVKSVVGVLGVAGFASVATCWLTLPSASSLGRATSAPGRLTSDIRWS